MKTRLMISSAMTPAEQVQGRFMRAPDGHSPEGETIMVDVPEEAEAPKPEPAEKADDGKKSIEQQYDEEFGGVDPATSDTDEGDEGDKEVSEEETSEEELEPKKKGASVQERFDEMTARNRQLERELAEFRRAAQPPAPKEEQVSKEVKAPDPTDYEFGAADEKFITDNARWAAEQRFDELQERANREANVQAIEAKWNEAVSGDEIKETYADFDDKVTKGADRKDWACSPVMAVLIKNSEVGPHVAYELASNAEESRRIFSLSTEEQLLEFGRLEGRMLAKKEFGGSQTTPAPKRTTSAPPPPESRARGSGGKFASPQDALYNKMLSEFN